MFVIITMNMISLVELDEYPFFPMESEQTSIIALTTFYTYNHISLPYTISTFQARICYFHIWEHSQTYVCCSA